MSKVHRPEICFPLARICSKHFANHNRKTTFPKWQVRSWRCQRFTEKRFVFLSLESAQNTSRTTTERRHSPNGRCVAGDVKGSPPRDLFSSRSNLLKTVRKKRHCIKLLGAQEDCKCQSKHTVDRWNPQPASRRHLISKFSGCGAQKLGPVEFSSM